MRRKIFQIHHYECSRTQQHINPRGRCLVLRVLPPLTALRLPVLPDGRGLFLCRHLHDPRRHGGEIHRSVSTSPIQVSKGGREGETKEK